MNISIVTDARSDAEGLALLRHMGMPFRQEVQRRQVAQTKPLPPSAETAQGGASTGSGKAGE